MITSLRFTDLQTKLFLPVNVLPVNAFLIICGFIILYAQILCESDFQSSADIVKLKLKLVLLHCCCSSFSDKDPECAECKKADEAIAKVQEK